MAEKKLHRLIFDFIKRAGHSVFRNEIMNHFNPKVGFAINDVRDAIKILVDAELIKEEIEADKIKYSLISDSRSSSKEDGDKKEPEQNAKVSKEILVDAKKLFEWIQKNQPIEVYFVAEMYIADSSIELYGKSVAYLIKTKQIEIIELNGLDMFITSGAELDVTSEKGKLIKRLNELALDNFVVSVAFITNKDMGEINQKAQSEAGRKKITEEVAGFILGSKNKDVYLAELKRYKKGGQIAFGDTVHVPSVNKTGMVYEITGDKVKVRFLKGIEEYKRDEVEKVKTFKTGGNQKGWEYTIGGL